MPMNSKSPIFYCFALLFGQLGVLFLRHLVCYAKCLWRGATSRTILQSSDGKKGLCTGHVRNTEYIDSIASIVSSVHCQAYKALNFQTGE